MPVKFSRRVAGCVLIKDGKFILQHRDNKTKYHPNTWGFFGGHIEEGETPEQTIIRELKEELGLDIKPTFFGRQEHESPDGAVERFVFVAPVTISEAQLRKQQTEGDDLGIFTIEEIRKLELLPHRRQVLEDVYKTMHLATAKAHSRS